MGSSEQRESLAHLTLHDGTRSACFVLCQGYKTWVHVASISYTHSACLGSTWLFPELQKAAVSVTLSSG